MAGDVSKSQIIQGLIDQGKELKFYWKHNMMISEEVCPLMACFTNTVNPAINILLDISVHMCKYVFKNNW